MEESFRSLLSGSLPPTNRVASGYFYGAGSRCGPEVDILIYDFEEAFRFNIANGSQVYVPNTSVSIIGEIKNSADQLDKAIMQVQESYKSWHEMRLEHSKVMTRGVVAGRADDLHRLRRMQRPRLWQSEKNVARRRPTGCRLYPSS